MKLFVDDTREPPKGYDFADCYNDAVFCIKYLDYEHISLDYSLGEYYTGLDIMKFIHENKRYPKTLNIHSDHVDGVKKMREYAIENFPPEVTVTVNSLNK